MLFEFTTDLQSVNDTSILVRLLLSLILGGFIGFERGKSGRPAGLRTHILVCLGSTMAMMTNQYIYQEFGISDPTRIAAQVISGIGFLGAGTILVTGKYQVKGLTTAAGLWATACMGLAIGIGFYKAAILSCLLIFFVTVILHRLDSTMLSKSKVMDLYIEFKDAHSISMVADEIKSNMIHITSIEIVKPAYGNTNNVAAILTIHLKKKRVRLDVVTKICAMEGVEFAEEI